VLNELLGRKTRQVNNLAPSADKLNTFFANTCTAYPDKTNTSDLLPAGSQKVVGMGVAPLSLSKYHLTPFTALCQREYGRVKPMPPIYGLIGWSWSPIGSFLVDSTWLLAAPAAVAESSRISLLGRWIALSLLREGFCCMGTNLKPSTFAQAASVESCDTSEGKNPVTGFKQALNWHMVLHQGGFSTVGGVILPQC